MSLIASKTSVQSLPFQKPIGMILGHPKHVFQATVIIPKTIGSFSNDSLHQGTLHLRDPGEMPCIAAQCPRVSAFTAE